MSVNWFDILIVTLVLGSLVKGFFSGLIMQLASLAGIVLGAIFAGKLSEYIAPEIIQYTGASPHVIGPLSYIIAFVIIVFTLFFLGRTLHSFVDAIQMGTLNRLAGAVFCTTKWIIILSILLNLLVEFDQHKHIIKEDVREHSHIYPLISEVGKTVVPYLRFDWIDQLKTTFPNIFQ